MIDPATCRGCDFWRDIASYTGCYQVCHYSMDTGATRTRLGQLDVCQVRQVGGVRKACAKAQVRCDAEAESRGPVHGTVQKGTDGPADIRSDRSLHFCCCKLEAAEQNAAEQGCEAGEDTGGKDRRPMPAVLLRRGVPARGRDVQREGEIQG